MSRLAKWGRKTLSNRIRERSPGRKMRGTKKCSMRCQAPALRPAAPSEEKPELSWSQTLNMSASAGSEEAFLLRCPKPCLRGGVFFEGHLTQESKVLNTMRILPWRKAQVKSQHEMKNQSRSQTSHIVSCRNPVLEDLWVMEGDCSIAEHKPLHITCAQKWLWALPVKLLSCCIIHICFMMTQCLPCWIFYFSGSKTINYSP